MQTGGIGLPVVFFCCVTVMALGNGIVISKLNFISQSLDVELSSFFSGNFVPVCVLYLEAPQGQNADWGNWASCGFRLLCDDNGDRVLGPLSNVSRDFDL